MFIRSIRHSARDLYENQGLGTLARDEADQKLMSIGEDISSREMRVACRVQKEICLRGI